MNLQTIFDLVNFVSDKEQQGKALSEDTYSTVLESVNWEKFTFEKQNLIKDELTPISGELIASSALNPFKKSVSLNPNNGDGTVAAPDDYVRFLAFTANYGGDDPVKQISIARYREVTPVHERQFAITQNNVYARPDIHPIVKIMSNNNVYPGKFVFTFLPYDITALSLDYLRTPKTPFYDYCMDEFGNAVYMPVGSYITSISDVNYLYDVNNTLLASNVTKDNMNVLPYTSKTVELEWEQQYYEDLINRILSKVGINLSADKVTAYAEQKLKDGN